MSDALRRGWQAYVRGEWPAARAAFGEVVAANPADPLAQEALGLACLRCGELDAARAALDAAEAAAGTQPPASVAYHRGLVEQAAERYAPALAAFEAAAARGHDPVEAGIGQAACLALLGESRRARETLAGLGAGDHPEAAYWDAVAAAQERDQPGMREHAARQLRGVLGRAEGVSDWLRGRAHFLLASLLDDDPAGYPEATENYLEGLAYDPGFVVGRNNLGAVYLSQGDVAAARRELNRALVADPTYRRVHGNLAALYFDKVDTAGLKDDLKTWAETLDPAGMSEAVLGLLEALMDEARSRAYLELYNRGHALKNLLALLGSRIKRLERRLPEGPALAKAAEGLRQQYDGVYSRLAEDLRLARPASGPSQRADLHRILRRVARRLEREGGEGTAVHLELDPRVPALFGDAEAISEALVNLGRNALEAMGGAGRIECRSRLSPGGDKVVLEVRDHGPGIAPEVAGEVFKRGVTTKPQGSGVGLALVQRTVKDWHGTVAAGNHPGGGAVFTVELPVAVRYHPSRSLGLAARPVRLELGEALNVDELA